jgi:hypothetical protein
MIEIADTVIKEPNLLPKAIEFLNDLGNYGVIECKLEQNAEGHITGGFFHLGTGESRYGRGHVYLRYHGGATPTYTEDGTLNGHFTLMGDEDFAENKRLGTLIGDHYSAQVAKRIFEERGNQVEFSVADNGEITVDAYEHEGVAASSY